MQGFSAPKKTAFFKNKSAHLQNKKKKTSICQKQTRSSSKNKSELVKNKSVHLQKQIIILKKEDFSAAILAQGAIGDWRDARPKQRTDRQYLPDQVGARLVAKAE